MSVYVTFDVEIRDMTHVQASMKDKDAAPALDAAGARYTSRVGVHKLSEGNWQPRRSVVAELTSVAAWEAFCTGSVYQGLNAARAECSFAKLVCVEGLA